MKKSQLEAQRVIVFIILMVLVLFVYMGFWRGNISNLFVRFTAGEIPTAINRLEHLEDVYSIRTCREVLEKMAVNRIIDKKKGGYVVDSNVEEEELKRINSRRTTSESVTTITIDEGNRICELYYDNNPLPGYEYDYSSQSESIDPITIGVDEDRPEGSYVPPEDPTRTGPEELNDLSESFYEDLSSEIDLELMMDSNYPIRRSFEGPRRIILHHTGGSSWEGAHGVFSSNEYNVGAHFLIDKDGRVTKHVDLNKGTHHACGANQETIGIEIVNDGGTEEYTDEQYESVKKIVDYLKKEIEKRKPNFIKEPFVIGHFEVEDNYYAWEFDTFGCEGTGKWDPSPDFKWNKVVDNYNEDSIRDLCQRVSHDGNLDFEKDCYII